MSIQAVAWVLENSSAELGARLALISIANHADAFGLGAYPSYETIGREARMTRRAAIDAVQRLVEGGHLRVRKGQCPHGTNCYEIIGITSEVSSPTPNRASEAASEVDRVSLVKQASPEPSLNLKPRNAPQKRTQAQIESDRRYGGEGARFPETTPEYMAEVERIADLSPLPAKPADQEAAKKARELVEAYSERKGKG